MSAIPPKHYGATAVGRTSRFGVVIDEAIDDPNCVQMDITARGWSFRFSLSTRDDVSRILSFLREHTGSVVLSELVVGSFSDAPVLLIKDSEFADRFWLRAFRGDQMVEFVLAADDLTEFTDAVAQAVQDLES